MMLDSHIMDDRKYMPASIHEARVLGYRTYVSGKECPKGHNGERWTNGSGCCECSKMATKAWAEKNKNRARAKQKEWIAANRERHAEYHKAYHVANQERNLKRSRDWYEKNRDRRLAICKAWREQNRKKSSDYVIKRRILQLNRIPAWADHEQIKEIYDECRRMTELTGISFNVDHVVPLQGKTVSGLHVEYNLRIIQASENCRKSNKLIETIL